MLGMQRLGSPGRNQTGDYNGAQNPQVDMAGAFSSGAATIATRASVLSGIYPQTQMAYPAPQKQVISKTRVAMGILNGHMEHYGSSVFRCPLEDFFIKYVYPIPAEEGGTRFHMIWQDHACMTGCWCDSNRMSGSVRKRTTGRTNVRR